MIIREIKLKDFRPFYGIQRIVFSEKNEKNITLINAENGSGKTTLLEAMKWCLYGKQLNLLNKEDFVNKRTNDETSIGEEVIVSVTIKFQDENYNYEACRSIYFRKKSNFLMNKIGENFSLYRTDLSDGIKIKISNPETEISNIIPSDINFFFDGERLAQFDNKKTLKDAIEGVLGVKSSNNAIKHLKKVKQNFQTEQSNIEEKNGNIDSVQLTLKEQGLNNDIDGLKEKIIENINEKKIAEENLLKLNEKLGEIKVIELLVSQKKGLEKECNDLKKEKEEAIILLRNKYKEESYYATISTLSQDVKKILMEKKEKKEVPSKVSEYLIKDILKEKICICGREVKSDSEEYERLKKLRKKSTSDKMATAFENALDFTKNSEIKKEIFFKDVKLLKEKIAKIEGKLEDKQGKLADIENQIGENKAEEVQNLRANIDDKRTKLKGLIVDEGRYKERLEELGKKLNEINARKKRIESSSDTVQLLRRRIEFTSELIDNIEALLDLKKNLIKRELNFKIQNIYEKATRKGYKIRLDEDFLIEIIDPTTEKIAPVSTGEQKIATLCFIGALADFARTIHKRKTDVETGKIFPIVLDSPFGDLDPEHREKVAELLPNLADQVILLASKSQYTEEVKKHMFPKVGEAYELYNRNPKQNPEIKFEFTEIFKKESSGKWVKS